MLVNCFPLYLLIMESNKKLHHHKFHTKGRKQVHLVEIRPLFRTSQHFKACCIHLQRRINQPLKTAVRLMYKYNDMFLEITLFVSKKFFSLMQRQSQHQFYSTSTRPIIRKYLFFHKSQDLYQFHNHVMASSLMH